MKPFYKSKKFWTAIVTAAAMVVAFVYGGDRGAQLAALITAVGSVLVLGFGLEDQGKAAVALDRAHDRDIEDDQ